MNLATAARPALRRELARTAAITAAAALAVAHFLALVTLPTGAGLPGIVSGTGAYLADLALLAVAVAVIRGAVLVARDRARRAAQTRSPR